MTIERTIVEGRETVVNDGYMQYINGLYYVREGEDDGKFYVCDVDGIEEGEELEHVSEGFDTLEEAIAECDAYQPSAKIHTRKTKQSDNTTDGQRETPRKTR